MTVVFYTPDSGTQKDMSHVLRTSFPKTPVLGLALPEMAAQWMDHSCEQPDLLVVDVDPCDDCGLNLVGQACSRWPQTPLVVLSTEPILDCFASITYLQKPVQELDLIALVHASLVGQPLSEVTPMRLRDVLLLHLRFGTSGALDLQTDDHQGTIALQGGVLTHAQTAQLQGIEALQTMFRWPSVHLAPLRPETESPHTIDISFEELLLEQWERPTASLASSSHNSLSTPDYFLYSITPTSAALNRPLIAPTAQVGHEHHHHSAAYDVQGHSPIPVLCPGFADAYTLADGEVLLNGSEDPTLDSSIDTLERDEHSFPVLNGATQQHQPITMDIRGLLGPLAKLDGFLAAAFIDSKRQTLLGQVKTDPFDLHKAAVFASELIALDYSTIPQLGPDHDAEPEEVLITLGQQHHIIRPSTAYPHHLVYLVLDRPYANLALACMALETCAAQVCC